MTSTLLTQSRPDAQPRAGTLSAKGILTLKMVVVLAGAVLMGFEILGSRVLAPMYGSSVYVWGSLISTFLTALALGYAFGGRIADRRPSVAVLSIILSAAVVLILPCVVWGIPLLSRLAHSGWDPRGSVLLATIVLFLPSSVAMGMVTPFAVRIAIRRMEAAGAVAGGYSALSTAGSILGTLLMTFFLIPTFAVNSLLLGLAAALVLCALLLARSRASVVIACLAAATGAMAGVAHRGGVASNERVLLQKDTAYHHILVTQLFDTRFLRFDNLPQSAINLKYPERMSRYQENLLLSLAIRPAIRRACMIGLGGGDLVRAMNRMRPDLFIETVEIDPAVREIAREFFLYRESEHARTVIQDGRAFLADGGPPYDLIFLDAFNSTGVPFHLTTREFFQTVHGRLSPNGIFGANFIGQLMGKDSRLFWATYKAIRRQFGQVYLLNPDLAAGRTTLTGNIVVFATLSGDPLDLAAVRRNAELLASRWKVPRADVVSELIHSPEPPPGTPELTDAYAPVEALQNF